MMWEMIVFVHSHNSYLYARGQPFHTASCKDNPDAVISSCFTDSPVPKKLSWRFAIWKYLFQKTFQICFSSTTYRVVTVTGPSLNFNYMSYQKKMVKTLLRKISENFDELCKVCSLKQKLYKLFDRWMNT